jgi:hypothetical protein
MTTDQEAYVELVRKNNPHCVVTPHERADGKVIVDVQERVRQVLGHPASGLRTLTLLLLCEDGIVRTPASTWSNL